MSYWLILLTSMKWKSLSDLLYMKEEKWHNHFGKQLQCHTELNRCLTFTQQRKKEIFFVPNSCMNDHSFICNNSKLGKKKKSINKWINKHIVVYPNLKILLSNRNEWTTDTFNNVDESQNNYFEWKKSATCKKKKKKKPKLFILDESIQKWKLSYGGRKQISGHGLGWGHGQQRREGRRRGNF